TALDDLSQVAVFITKTGAKRFVTRADLVNRGSKNSLVERSLEPQSCRNVVGCRPGHQLVQEPQPLLHKRDRQIFRARYRHDRGQRFFRYWLSGKFVSQSFYGWFGEYRRKRQIDPKKVTNRGNNSDSIQ